MKVEGKTKIQNQKANAKPKSKTKKIKIQIWFGFRMAAAHRGPLIFKLSLLSFRREKVLDSKRKIKKIKNFSLSDYEL